MMGPGRGAGGGLARPLQGLKSLGLGEAPVTTTPVSPEMLRPTERLRRAGDKGHVGT